MKPTWARASTPLGKTAAQPRSGEHASWGTQIWGKTRKTLGAPVAPHVRLDLRQRDASWGI